MATRDPKVPRRRRLLGLCLVIGLYLFTQFVIPKPASVTVEGWRLFGIFLATIGGLIVQPIAGGAMVLIAVTLASVFGGLTIQEALGGFGDPTVWLVMAAFFISSAMIKTGVARRIALLFVRATGKTSLGVTYALGMTDLVLAAIIPSNGARSGGVVLPIARSVTELYKSFPGESSRVLGSFLMTAVYQSICVTAAMFLTGQASNPLAAKIAADSFGLEITWLGWALAGLVPGAISMALVPLIVYRLDPPKIKRTPEAAQFATDELQKMGPINREQAIVLAVFAGVCALWITSPLHKLDIAVSALIGSCALLATGVLTWEDVVSEKAAWDIFIWYGGLVRLGRALNDAGVTREYATTVGAWFGDYGWPVLLGVALVIYFYSHYGFASITAHMLAMFTPFASVLMVKDAPPGLVFYSFACFTNLCSGLTNYGTTPSPMFFATDYVTFRDWWRAGFIVSVANIVIWSTVGFAWWKLLGIW
jgi:DASS family divalent anion:Na+ symporter